MRFVFVRHGHYDKGAADRKAAALTPAGEMAAKLAGQFLAREGIQPDLVCTTDTKRTQQTARIALRELGLSEFHPVGPGFAIGKNRKSLDEKIAEWIGVVGFEPQTLVFVGHDTQQEYCLKKLEDPVAVPDHNRGCVLIYEKNDQGKWALRGHSVGTAP